MVLYVNSFIILKCRDEATIHPRYRDTVQIVEAYSV